MTEQNDRPHVPMPPILKARPPDQPRRAPPVEDPIGPEPASITPPPRSGGAAISVTASTHEKEEGPPHAEVPETANEPISKEKSSPPRIKITPTSRGKETLAPVQGEHLAGLTKKASQHFGKLIRTMDEMGISNPLSKELRAIAEALGRCDERVRNWGRKK